MAKRQMDHMNHMAKEITWKRKSHGKRNHSAREIPWQEKSHDKRNHMTRETEVQSQQMAFTQSPSVCNPKIPTYYLIFAETREIT